MIELIERPVSILLVDDDPERESLARRLKRQSPHYQVLHVLSLAAAITAISKLNFDVILCDYYLEEGHTARDLVNIVVTSYKSTKVVVFSGQDDSLEIKRDILEDGAFWYLTKPIVFSELLHTVKTIESFRRERELSEASAKLAQISSRFHSTLQLNEVVTRAVDAALELGFSRARLYFLDEERGVLNSQAVAGMPEDSLAGFEIPLSGSGLIDRIFGRREPTAWSYESSREFSTSADVAWIVAVGLQEVPWIDCPLLVGEKRIGTLAVDRKGTDNPLLTPRQCETIGILADLVAQAVNNCRLYEAEARAQASLLQILIEAPDAVITTTLDGTIDFVSPSTESVLGLSASQLVRKKAADVYINPSGDPGTGEAIAEEVMSDLRAGRSVNNRRVHVVGPDGRPLVLSLSASLLHSRDGSPIGTLGFLKSLGFLEQQFEEYRNLLESFGYGTVIVSLDGSISFLNRKAERLLGDASCNLLGKSLAKLLRPQDCHRMEERLSSAEFGDGAPLRVEVSSATGETVPLELYISPIRVGSDLRGFAVGLYDRREQERLIWAGRLAALGEMVVALAHEINNPLNNILTAIKMLEGLAGDRLDDGSRQDCFDTIAYGARRIADLVRRLRRLSRNEPVAFVEVGIAHLVHDFLGFFSQRFRAGHIDTSVLLPEENLIIYGDPVQIEQVLTSVVVNAEEAMSNCSPKKLSIVVRKKEHSQVEISIEDSGPGVPEIHRDEIFDMFFTTKSRQGTGFGLAISRSIAREHHGDLRVENAISGKGARFVLTLPLVKS